MKSFSILAAVAALATQASAHYVWPQLIVGGTNTSSWQYVRQTNNWQDLNPLTDVTSTDVRCYDSAQSGTASTVTVAAGSKVGFTVSGNPANLYHAGVLNVYMAKAPSGTDVANWDGSGTVWFKVYQISAVTDGGSTITFPTTGMSEITFTIPAATPSGQYLIRTEHIAIHSASYFGGAQFYIACAQVEVTNGGSGTPGPLVAFPGAYTGNEPGILINIYYPIPATYTQPGPAVWSGSGSAGTSSPATTTAVTTVKTTTTVATTTSTSKTGSSTGGTVAQYGQCGGQGYTGATSCVSPFNCKATNQYYSQCL
ncbi:glycosyl hydrolase family 61-domain-containing protein [Mycena belliarum]|uniref:lytic cellulose monooxygenase (C4-dehydrogenating) n=1 Tax=Mycena belliarum TaxID=1033014 RepID=A0AAD6UFF8_9AGAR|nr:glycosyl hydrolase family 61-domain-containing protein [Mycena belliae]